MDTNHTNLPPRIPGLEKLGIFDGTENGRNVYQEKGLDDVYYWFGTDTLGRDLWTRTWAGTRVSLIIAFFAALGDLVIGVTYGMISGYLGGRTDMVMQRIIEIVNGIPSYYDADGNDYESRTGDDYRSTFDDGLDWHEQNGSWRGAEIKE